MGNIISITPNRMKTDPRRALLKMEWPVICWLAAADGTTSTVLMDAHHAPFAPSFAMHALYTNYDCNILFILNISIECCCTHKTYGSKCVEFRLYAIRFYVNARL